MYVNEYKSKHQLADLVRFLTQKKRWKMVSEVTPKGIRDMLKDCEETKKKEHSNKYPTQERRKMG